MPRPEVPGVGPLRDVARRLRPLGSSAAYWERRYRAGGTSGEGSYGANATMKADIVNRVVVEHDLASVTEFGCGDGNQLTLLQMQRYVGLDVSAAAIETCSRHFSGDATKSFFRYDPEHFVDRARVFRADLALSQEVIFHLVEDDVFDRYMTHLFDAADRLVLICSTNHEERPTKHVRHREFTAWVADRRPEWQLRETLANPLPPGPDGEPAVADFYLFGPAATGV
jgi:SAM-dependent methyltransferase